ncbi:ClpX C4-type zinc finger protein [Streptomyces sp. P17]|uniref:ClpX C4-type zinc finger protein n=1 Tax=Streptomyces sp. P17 TaxID=3074716 RepID=UPI0028F4184A|nr:ClpX C4-type zinc finger protein [Streptomyces sp. P17]MDT9701271.1 ClpX C4-type zinc finger protein [Streptomyces sp. P17]
MSPEPTVEQLIQAAHERAASGDPLDLLDAVLAVTGDLAGRTDAAVDQVVRQARDAGYSWTVIGERLGVSRQAARQRYADRVARTSATVGLIRGRDVQAAVATALAAAEADHLAEAGTEHLLLGLLTDGVAAATMEQLGITRDKIRDASHRLFDYPTQPAGAGRPDFSAEAQAALHDAEQLATERTPTCAPVVVRTPQLLAVIATNPGSRARRVLNDLGVDVADIKRRLHCYINVPRTVFGRRTRHKRRPEEPSARCSFCGEPGNDERRLVAGPDVWICADCVTLCGEILAQPAGAGSA